jgi:hypothetical protein
MQSLMLRQIGEVNIGQRVKDGYINATAMCQAAGKRWYDYARLDTSDAFVQQLSRSTGIPALQLIQSVTGGGDQVPREERGTWVHPRIAIHLAMWCSPEFAVQVTGWVEEWYRTQDNPLASHPQKTIPFMALFSRQIQTALSRVHNSLIKASGRSFADGWNEMHLMHHGQNAKGIKREANLRRREGEFGHVKGWYQLSARRLLWHIDTPANLTESMEIDLRRCGVEDRRAWAIALTEGRAYVDKVLEAGATLGSLSEDL